MKKSIIYLLLAVFAAGIAAADDSAPWWKFGFGDDPEKELVPPPEPPPEEGPRFEGRRSDMREMRKHRGPMMNEEQRAKIKAYYEEIHRLAEAARSEADPVKKEALVGQLRIKLTEGAERMQEEFRKRLEKAEQEVVKMRDRLEEGEKNMSARVEEHLQRILSGESPERSRRGSGPHEGRPKPDDAE